MSSLASEYRESAENKRLAFKKAQAVLELFVGEEDRILLVDEEQRHEVVPSPGVVFQYWDKVQPPEEIVANFQRWSGLCSRLGYNHRVFNDQTADFFISNSFPRYSGLYRSALHPAMKADIFRVLFASLYGGCWIDADIPPTLSEVAFYNALSRGATVLYLRRNRGRPLRVSNMFFVAHSGCAFFEKLSLSLPDRIESGEGQGILQETGPGFFTRTLVGQLFENYCLEFGSDTQESRQRLILSPCSWLRPFREKCEYKKNDHWSRKSR